MLRAIFSSSNNHNNNFGKRTKKYEQWKTFRIESRKRSDKRKSLYIRYGQFQVCVQSDQLRSERKQTIRRQIEIVETNPTSSICVFFVNKENISLRKQKYSARARARRMLRSDQTSFTLHLVLEWKKYSPAGIIIELCGDRFFLSHPVPIILQIKNSRKRKADHSNTKTPVGMGKMTDPFVTKREVLSVSTLKLSEPFSEELLTAQHTLLCVAGMVLSPRGVESYCAAAPIVVTHNKNKKDRRVCPPRPFTYTSFSITFRGGRCL